jgi:exopolysaccharide biosynthesis polyprenyl glycosylphosphotransferase
MKTVQISEVPAVPAADSREVRNRLVAVSASLREHRRERRRLMMVDFTMLALSAGVATGVGMAVGWEANHTRVALCFVAVTLFGIVSRGVYDHRLGASPMDEFGRLAAGTALAAMSLITAEVLISPDGGETAQLARLWAFCTVYLIAGRAGLLLDERRSRRRTHTGEPTLIIGAGIVGRRLAERLRDRPELGLRPVGFLDKEPMGDEDAGLPVLGASWDLEHVAVTHSVRHVIVTFSTAPNEVLLDIARRCNRLGIEVAIVPRLFEQLTSRLSVEHIGGIPLLRAGHIDPKGWQFDVKYALDRMVAATVLLFISPLMVAIAAAVKLSSPGPVFHRQRRVGLDGREFTLLKFRSMTGSPDSHGEADAMWLAAIAGPDGVTGADAAPVPDRRTRVGRLLRRTSLDELPQLLNILHGDMSFVGPRPERVTAVRAVEGHVYRYGDRHRVKSGLTGWAQVHGLRGETSLDDRVEWDNHYIENWSALMDLKILLMTPPAVLSGQGTH